MHIQTTTAEVTINDPPNPDKLTQIVVNLQDMTVELTYQGHPPLSYCPHTSSDETFWTPA